MVSSVLLPSLLTQRYCGMHMRQTSSPTNQELRNSTDSRWAWRKCNTGGRWNRLCEPSAVQACGFVPAPLSWNGKDDWQQGAELLSREVMGCQVGGLWRTFTLHTFEIFIFADQQLSFPSSAWIILYSNTIIWRFITCSPGDLGFSFFLLLTMMGALPREQPTELIPDNLWCTSYTSPAFLWRFCKSI